MKTVNTIIFTFIFTVVIAGLWALECNKPKPVMPKAEAEDSILMAARLENTALMIEINRANEKNVSDSLQIDSLRNLVKLYDTRSTYKGQVITQLIKKLHETEIAASGYAYNPYCDSLASEVESGIADVQNWKFEANKVDSLGKIRILDLQRANYRLKISNAGLFDRLSAYDKAAKKTVDTLKALIPSNKLKFYLGADLMVPGLNAGPVLHISNDRYIFSIGTLFGTAGQTYKVGAAVKINFPKLKL